MGLITFFLLGAFSLLYLSKSIENRPAFVDKAVAFISENMEKLSVVGVIYGLIAAILVPIMVYGTSDILVRLLANVTLFALALPYAFDRICTKYGDKINSALQEELRGIIGKISVNEKIAGIVGAVFTVLLFAVLFR